MLLYKRLTNGAFQWPRSVPEPTEETLVKDHTRKPKRTVDPRRQEELPET